jgi:hypothetical protein
VLARNDFNDTAEVARTLNQFERHYGRDARPRGTSRYRYWQSR